MAFIKMKIIIRADGRKKLGMGHIIRSIALAHHLQNIKPNADVVFITKFLEGEQMLKDFGFTVVLLEDNEISQLKSLNGDVLITDFLNTDNNLLLAIKKQTNLKIISIDNNTHLKELCADIVVNANVFSEQSLKTINNTTYLLGPQYMLLRDSFNNSKKEITADARSIFVMFGGTDPCGNTIKTIEALKESENLKLNVVLGPGFNSHNELDKMMNSAKADINLFFSPRNIIDVMNESDIAVLSSGVSLFEIACLGIPSITIPQADHEEDIAKEFHSRGASLNLGRYPSQTTIRESVNNLLIGYDKRVKISLRAQQFIDGNGLSRLTNKIDNFLSEY